MLTISVVIPTFNEEKNINNLLYKLENQTIPLDEIIIADDGSTDRTKEIVLQLCEEHSDIILLECEHEGVNSMRHYGTIEATSDIILQTDADVIPPADWIERILDHFESDSELIGVSGNVADSEGRPLESIAVYLANLVYTGLGANSAFLKEYYQYTSGYPVGVPIHHGGDIIFWDELKQLGKTIHNSSIVVAHKSGYKWRAVGAGVVTTASVAKGAATYYLGSPLFGIMGIGGAIGFATAEIGSQIVPLQNEEDREYAVNFTGVHHDVWGLAFLVSTLILDKTSIIKSPPLLFGMYGFSIAVIVHHLMTEPRGCFGGICFRPLEKIEKSYCPLPVEQ